MAHVVGEIDWTKATSIKVEVGDTVEILGKRSGVFTFHFADDVPYIETAEESHTRKVLGKRSPEGFSFAIAPHARSRKYLLNCFLDGEKVPLQGEGAGQGNAQLQIGVEPQD